MTEEELNKIPFHMTGHMSMAHEHTCAYADESGDLGFCDHTKVKGDGEYGEFGRTYRHYRIKGKIYKSYKKFLEALKDYDVTRTRA